MARNLTYFVQSFALSDRISRRARPDAQKTGLRCIGCDRPTNGTGVCGVCFELSQVGTEPRTIRCSCCCRGEVVSHGGDLCASCLGFAEIVDRV